MREQTPAEAPMPLCLPTPSLGYQKDIDDAEKTADAVSASLHGLKKKAPLFVQAQSGAFFKPCFCIFPRHVHILFHRPSAKGHGRIIRRLRHAR